MTPAAAFEGGHISIAQRIEIREHLDAQIGPGSVVTGPCLMGQLI